MAFRVLSGEQVADFKERYIRDDLNQEDLTELRKHLSTEGWFDLEKEKQSRGLQRQRAAGGTIGGGGIGGAVPGIVPIGLGRSDAQIAQELRADLQARLEAIGEIMTKAKRDHGMTIGFQFTPPDSFGRVSLAALEISKKLC